ncbi:MAG: fibronectin type III domain-containing protein, partial [Thermoplasmata archaeon]|nr:fibronectin type III domain-containing protein [Thermoplasmata archaeon]
VNGVGEGPKSNEANATPTSGPTVPSEPRNLQATAGNQQSTLTWDSPVSDGGSPITGYRIYRGTIPGEETFLVEIGNVLTYTDTGLINGQTYFYRISAANSVGEGPKSNKANATPGSPPSAPQNPQAVGGDDQILITWDGPASDGGFPITNYNIYRGTTSEGETFHVQLGNVLSYVDTNVAKGQTYYYRVSAENSVGEGAKSMEVFATSASVPGPPLGLTATAGNRQVTLNWNALADDGGLAIVNYTIYRGIVSGETTTLIGRTDSLEYSDNNVSNGVTYFYRVAAVNDIGEGFKSEEANATPYNIPPTCSIQDPPPLTTISGTYRLAGTASDLDGTVQLVEIRIGDGPWVQATDTENWFFDWNSRTSPDGTHTIYARSFDGTSYSLEVAVSIVVENAVQQEPLEDWFWMVIVVLVVAAFLGFIVLMRKKKGTFVTDESPGSEKKAP